MRPCASSSRGVAVAALSIARACSSWPWVVRKARARSAPTQPSAIPLRRQALIGVVGSERQPKLGARGEHAIGLGDAMGRQIVDHHAEVRLGAVERRERLAAGLARGVDPRNDPLRPRLLIAGRAVDLAGQEQAAEAARFQRRIEPARVDVVVFDRVAGTEDARMLEARNRGDERGLRLRRQRGRNAVRIDCRIVDAFGLEEDLVAVAIGEADHLVLDRRTIAWAAPGDRARIDGGAMRIGADDAMGLGRGAGDVAGELRRRDPCRQRREEFRLGIAVLDLELHPSRSLSRRAEAAFRS